MAEQDLTPHREKFHRMSCLETHATLRIRWTDSRHCLHLRFVNFQQRPIQRSVNREKDCRVASGGMVWYEYFK